MFLTIFGIFEFFTLRLAWQVALKKTNVKLFLLTDIVMLLMIEKGIRGETCHAIHRFVKANTQKIVIKIKNHHILKIWT